MFDKEMDFACCFEIEAASKTFTLIFVFALRAGELELRMRFDREDTLLRAL